MARKKFKAHVRVNAPLVQEIEIYHRYDKEWKTNFITLSSGESSALDKPDARKFCEEVVMCFNTKEEFRAFVSYLAGLEKKFK